MSLEKKVEISVRPERIEGDPPATVYFVKIESSGMNAGEWRDSFGSLDLLRAYLRGVKAGALMYADKHIELPEIPREEV